MRSQPVCAAAAATTASAKSGIGKQRARRNTSRLSGTHTSYCYSPPMLDSSPSARTLLRHAIATIAYRGGKALREAPASFASYRCAPGTRTPVEILAHVGDLFDWAVWLSRGKHVWNESEPLPWDREVERFFTAIERFDGLLASDHDLGCTEERLFQGPLADALTHVGQLTMLRRMQGAPVRAENYFKAKIETGRTGADQPTPVYEFDRRPAGGTS